MTDQNEGAASYISPPLRSYLDDVFNRVPLHSKYKEDLREELATHLEDRAEELVELGYKPYAVDEEVIRRVGNPEVIADQYNRVESLRSWFRDPVCLNALAWVAAGFFAILALSKLACLILGLSIPDPQLAYDLDHFAFYFRLPLAILTGFAAYVLYYRRSGNPHRYTPFALLSFLLVFCVTSTAPAFDIISAFPHPQFRLVLMADVPSPFTSPPFSLHSFLVYEMDFSGISFSTSNTWYHSLRLPYSPSGPVLFLTEMLVLSVVLSFVIEKLRQRQSFRLY